MFSFLFHIQVDKGVNCLLNVRVCDSLFDDYLPFLGNDTCI